MKSLRLLLVPSILVLIIATHGLDVGAAPVAAGSISCQNYATSHACKRKDVTSTGADTWTAGVKSYMDNPVITIDTIGYAYWTAYVTCDGDISYWKFYTGQVIYNASSFQDWSYHLKPFCGGSRWGHSVGNHDFHKSGYTHIWPYHSFTTPF